MSHAKCQNDRSIAEPAQAPRMPVVERTVADIERQVLAVSVESSVDELCAAIDASDWLLARAKEVSRLKRGVGIAWIDHNGEFDVGSVHYSVGDSFDVKCIDVSQTGHAVLNGARGDFDQFLAVLIAQPFKHGAVRNIVGKAMHDRLFRARLVGGVPERVLKRVDCRFLRRPHLEPSHGGEQ